MLKERLEKFFNPRSIAVIGASSDRSKIGYEILKNIKDGKFSGDIFPVNLNSKKILGLKSYASVLDVSKKIDLAIIVIPANFVNSVLRDCGNKGIKNVIVISSGFKESGKDGKKREDEMKKIAEEFDMKIIGPNCLGVINPYKNLNASFAYGDLKKGNIAFVSQSGAIISSVIDWASGNNVGFSKMVSVGNKAVVSENDLLNYFKEDDSVSAIFAYLEDISFGKEFIKVCSEVIKKKPLVILKPGTGKSSQKAMKSHTGALSGSNKGIDLAFKESGAVRAENLEDFFNLIKFFSRYEKGGNRMAIITNAGGPGVVATDEIEKRGLKIANLSSATKESLRKILPESSSVNNPIDLLGDAKSDRYAEALKILDKEKNIDGLLVILTPQSGTEIKKTAKVISDFSKNTDKIILTNFIGGNKTLEAVNILDNSDLVNLKDISDSAYVVEKGYEYSKNKKQTKKIFSSEIEEIQKKESIDDLNFIESLGLLKKYGINTVDSYVAFSSEEAVAAAERMQYPLVMKIFSDSITHKTDVAGVKVGVKDRVEVQEYFNLMKDKLGENLKGVVVQPMVYGQEIIMGIKKDDNFGHIVMFGLGGVYAEILKDVSFGLAPIDQKKAVEMIESIKSFEILNGYRSLPKINIEKMAQALVSISDLVCDYPEIKELDINPIIANEKKYYAVDVRIIF